MRLKFSAEEVRLLVAAALSYAACISFGYRSWTFGVAVEQNDPAAQLFNAGAIAAAAGVVIACFLLRNRFRYGFWMLFGGNTVLLGASVLAFGAVSGVLSSLCYPVAMALAGLGAGVLMPSCYGALTRSDARSVSLAYGLMAAGAMACAMVAEFAGQTLLLCANVLYLAISTALFWKSREALRDDSARAERALFEGRKKHKLISSRLFVAAICVLVVSAIYGITHTASFAASIPREVSAPLAQGAGLVAGLVFALYFGVLGKEPSATQFSVSFGLLGGAVILLPFLSGMYPALLYALSSGLWKIMLLMLLYMVALSSDLHYLERLALFALAYGIPRLGIFMGVGAIEAFSAYINSESTRLIVISLAALYAILAVFWFVNSYERRQAQQQADSAKKVIEQLSHAQGDAQLARLDSLAQQYGLTKRESEVLALLAYGRDLAFISGELYLSRNTVKGYQKSIYAKLGVHSKQELIDFIR